MLKTCQGLSAPGCRIVRSLSSWIFWGVEGRHPPSSSRVYTTVKVSFHLFLSFSFLANIWQQNDFPGGVRPVWILPFFSWSILLALNEEASLSCSLSWGSFVGEYDCSPCHQSGEEWIWASPISPKGWSISTGCVCQWQEIIPPRHVEKTRRVSHLSLERKGGGSREKCWTPGVGSQSWQVAARPSSPSVW